MTLVLSGTSGVALDSIKNSLMFLETAKATTSGTSIDFTGIPSWAKKITVLFNGVSTNGTSRVQLQTGSGSFTTSGYSSVGSGTSTNGINSTSLTTGYALANGSATTDALIGSGTLTLISGNTWVWSAVIGRLVGSDNGGFACGSLTLSSTLDRIRITTANGTDTFDAGSINILIEGYV